MGKAALGLRLFLLSEHLEGLLTPVLPSSVSGAGHWQTQSGKQEKGLSAASIWLWKPMVRPFQTLQDLAAQAAHALSTFTINKLRNPAAWFFSGSKWQEIQFFQKENMYIFVLFYNP